MCGIAPFSLWAQQNTGHTSNDQSSPAAPSETQTRITPDHATQLFGSVDAILQFDSQTTGLQIRHSVKRRLVSRDEIEQYLNKQLRDDRTAKRLQRSELVLKKIGLLDRDFELQPFLVRLLREQIAGYYDDKAGTVNLLDWIPPEEQKPVLAHELTHALQDQHIHLEKWDEKSELSIPRNAREDNEHIAVDEADTARDAVVEGQAMAVFIDYALAPAGKNILTAPDLADKMTQAMSDSTDSPTLANAPLLLQRSLLFPYVEGLNFVREVLAAKGKQTAFAGMLNHPPSSTYEIMTPKIYLEGGKVPLLHMPDIHSLIDPEYRPYDIGVMGEFDVQVLVDLFGGDAAAAALAPMWRGGIYYTAQSKAAKTDAEKNSPDSLALLYLSQWATPAAAKSFADIYGRQIPRRYDNASLQPEDEDQDLQTSNSTRIWNTSAGPVLIVVSDRAVFISESFPIDLARKLQLVMLGSIGDASDKVVRLPPNYPSAPDPELTAELRQVLFALGGLPAAHGIDNVAFKQHSATIY